uniref:Uncharacterized protein n=1 Tax=Molossus molossus TaxID=27622 RepID=A0A7J8DUC3_MOLMO|nr:hypothetical protein HJG59_009172 [Molossus molossus]
MGRLLQALPVDSVEEASPRWPAPPRALGSTLERLPAAGRACGGSGDGCCRSGLRAAHMLPDSASQRSAHAVPSRQDTGTAAWTSGESPAAEQKHVHGRAGSVCRPYPVDRVADPVRGAVGRSQRNQWVLFLDGNTGYFPTSIMFKVNLWIYNFNVQIDNSHR